MNFIEREFTVAGVLGGMVLAFEHVAQVPVAAGTQDFSSEAIRIR